MAYNGSSKFDIVAGSVVSEWVYQGSCSLKTDGTSKYFPRKVLGPKPSQTVFDPMDS